MSELKDMEEVKLDTCKSMCDKSSITPESMTSSSKGRETRLDLQSKISDLELKTVLLQEEC